MDDNAYTILDFQQKVTDSRFLIYSKQRDRLPFTTLVLEKQCSDSNNTSSGLYPTEKGRK